MSSNFKKIVATTTASLCLMVLTQVSTAQSGTVISGYQPQQAIPSQAVPQSYQPQQSYGQPYQAQPYQSQQIQQSQIARVGFDQYDHRGFDSLLQKYVDQRGNVDYVTWQSNSQDRSVLLNYLRGMSSVDTSLQASRRRLA